MKKRLSIFASGLLLILAASCAAPLRSNLPPSPGATSVPETMPIGVSPPPSSQTTMSLPLFTDPPSSAPSTAAWNICTWELYGLNSNPAILRTGQPVKIWAFIYIEDFPVTDVDTDLLVNGVVVDSQVVTVNFDEAWPVYFDYTPDRAGTVQITVRAILAVNAAFAIAPGGGNNYYELSNTMVIQP
jgi:hypothetical protein